MNALAKMILSHKTPEQIQVIQAMQNKWLTMENLVEKIIDVAQNAERSTPTGEVIDDHKTRLAAAKLLFDLAGYVPKAGKQAMVKQGLSSHLFIDEETIDGSEDNDEWLTEDDLDL